MSYTITYHHGAIADSANNVIQHAASMMGLHADVEHRTNALLGEFSGINATAYQDNQQPFLQAFQHLIETVHNLGRTILVVSDDMGGTDQSLAQMV